MSLSFNIADVLDAIDEADRDELPLIEASLTARKIELGVDDGPLTMQSINIGDTLFFNDGTSNYLRGLPVEVVDKLRTRVVVKVPDESRYRRFQGQSRVKCPLTVLSRNPY